MGSPDCRMENGRIKRFGRWERVFWRALLAGLLAVGTGAIAAHRPMAAAAYLLACLAGTALLALRGLCAHCPYPYRHDTCLFFPPAMLKKCLPYRGPNMSLIDKAGVLAVFAMMVAAPQWWLFRQPSWLALYWLLAATMAVAFPTCYCRHCRHAGCPLNRTPEKP